MKKNIECVTIYGVYLPELGNSGNYWKINHQ